MHMDINKVSRKVTHMAKDIVRRTAVPSREAAAASSPPAPRTGEEAFPVADGGGGLAQVRARVLPQVVPMSLLEHCQHVGQELATMPLTDSLAVAMVVDEAERYRYITLEMLTQWQAKPVAVLALALQNLKKMSLHLSWKQIGSGAKAMFLCETFDGYDASRVLLGGKLVELAGRTAGSLLIGMPHRDFLVALGDSDPEFVSEMQELVQEYFDTGSYPIAPNLFWLQDGRLVPYPGAGGVSHPAH